MTGGLLGATQRCENAPALEDLTMPRMNDRQFDVICKLTRGNPESAANLAARGVLVEGKTQAESMHATGATRSSVHDAVKRFSATHALILEAYGSSRDRA